MNYSKNLKRTAIAKRVIALACAAFLLGLSAGGIMGYALTITTDKHMENRQADKSEQAEEKTLVYGPYDECCFTEEASLDWNAGDLDFKPLDCRMPEEHQEFTFYICSAYHMDFLFVMALIQCESNFDPSAISKTEDYGYMQINIQNHKWLTETLGIIDYTDPYQNIRAGVFVLRKLFERYQDVNMVLMAYNLGENGAERLWSKGIFTTDYTQDVLTIQQQLKEQLEDN